MKVIEKIRAVAKVLGASCIMFGIIAVACACGSDDVQVIMTGLKWAAVIAACSLPCFAVSITMAAIIDRLED